jgi:hypothetical protein
LDWNTSAVLLDSAPAAAAVAPVPLAPAVTGPEFVAVDTCETLELFFCVAETLIDCEIAPPDTAAISASVNITGLLIGLTFPAQVLKGTASSPISHSG